MQGISDGMSCAVNEARLAVDVGYWPLYRYTPETELPSTTDEVRLRGKGCNFSHCRDMHATAASGLLVSLWFVDHVFLRRMPG